MTQQKRSKTSVNALRILTFINKCCITSEIKKPANKLPISAGCRISEPSTVLQGSLYYQPKQYTTLREIRQITIYLHCLHIVCFPQNRSHLIIPALHTHNNDSNGDLQDDFLQPQSGSAAGTWITAQLPRWSSFWAWTKNEIRIYNCSFSG